MGGVIEVAGSALSVDGFCPECGEQTLVLVGSRLQCVNEVCPKWDAAHALLQDREVRHVVQVGQAGWTVRHPLVERIDDELMVCGLHAHLDRILRHNRPPVGRYWLSFFEATQTWEWGRA